MSERERERERKVDCENLRGKRERESDLEEKFANWFTLAIEKMLLCKGQTGDFWRWLFKV